MKILAIEHDIPNLKTEDFQPHLKAETRRVWELYQAGIIREIYFRADQTTAVLILECEHIQEANKLLSTLPLVKENLIRFELIPLVAYPGFERLFETESI